MMEVEIARNPDAVAPLLENSLGNAQALVNYASYGDQDLEGIRGEIVERLGDQDQIQLFNDNLNILLGESDGSSSNLPTNILINKEIAGAIIEAYNYASQDIKISSENSAQGTLPAPEGGGNSEPSPPPVNQPVEVPVDRTLETTTDTETFSIPTRAEFDDTVEQLHRDKDSFVSPNDILKAFGISSYQIIEGATYSPDGTNSIDLREYFSQNGDILLSPIQTERDAQLNIVYTALGNVDLSIEAPQAPDSLGGINGQLHSRTNEGLNWLKPHLGDGSPGSNTPYGPNDGSSYDCIGLAVYYLQVIDPTIVWPHKGRGDMLTLQLNQVGALTTDNSGTIVTAKGIPEDVQPGDYVGLGHTYDPGANNESHLHCGIVSRVERNPDGSIRDILWINASGSYTSAGAPRGAGVIEESLIDALRNPFSNRETHAFIHRIPPD